MHLRRALRSTVAAAALLVGACHGADHDHDAEPVAWLSAEPAPSFEGLAVKAGRPLRLEDERGRILMLSFGYTACKDACPLTFRNVQAVYRELGAASRDVDFVYVTVDPDRDTPAVLRDQLASINPRFEGLRLQGDALASMLVDYGVTTRKRLPDPEDYARRDADPGSFYAMDHTSGLWVIDRRGRLRVRYGHDADPADVVSGVRKLVEEGR
jgi:protein SCO1/2